MHPLTMALADDHLRDLRNEAAARHLVALGDADRSGRLPDWRRRLGAGVEGLSIRLAGLAARLDPPSPRSRHAVRRYGAE